MFCKKCGTLYDPKNGPCPKCAAEAALLQEEQSRPAEAKLSDGMSEEEDARARKRSWIQLLIGIPAFIGFIYLLVYLYKLVKG